MIQKLFLIILAIPKSLFFNLKYFKLKEALKLPVLISHRVYLMQTKGSVIIENPLKFAMVRIGFGEIGLFDQQKSRAIWHVSGRVIFKGTARIGYGTKLSVTGGELTIGDGFRVTAETQIACNKKISFGEDVLISWDNLIMDTDYHSIINNEGKVINEDKEVVVGDHVWIGCRCTVLKGSKISSNSVIAANTNIYGDFTGNENTIIGGNPARVLKKDVTWKA